MIYNFRIDRNRRDKILQCLNMEHKLSQGWGGGESGGLDVHQPDFVSKCKDFYGLVSTRIPTNLTRMRNFKNDDIIVTPHLPKDGKVSIHVIDGDFPSCYDYHESNIEHLNNRLRIKKSYGLDGSISIYNVRLTAWYAKLPWMRLPILPMPEHEPSFRVIMQQADGTPNMTFEASTLLDYLSQLRYEILTNLKNALNAVSPNNGAISFEAICGHLLASEGYRIVGRNQFDGAGGDVDLRCIRARAEFSPFESGETLLFVQVKRHEGSTDKWAVEQLLKMVEKEPEADACVMSLADEFTDDARVLAEKHGVLLLAGDSISKLLFTAIAKFGS